MLLLRFEVASTCQTHPCTCVRLPPEPKTVILGRQASNAFIVYTLSTLAIFSFKTNAPVPTDVDGTQIIASTPVDAFDAPTAVEHNFIRAATNTSEVQKLLKQTNTYSTQGLFDGSSYRSSRAA